MYLESWSYVGYLQIKTKYFNGGFVYKCPSHTYLTLTDLNQKKLHAMIWVITNCIAIQFSIKRN